MASTPTGRGYWIAADDGSVAAFGDARHHGDMAARRLNQPVIAMSATPSGDGYWLESRDGGVFSFGDARFAGSLGGRRLNQPVVSMSPTRSGTGYWLVAADGGVFSFGDARFHGSTGNRRLNQPIVGLTPAPSGGGYWLVARDGGVFTFGDAPFLGAATGRLGAPALGALPLPGGGYRVVDGAGAALAFEAQPTAGVHGLLPATSGPGRPGSSGDMAVDVVARLNRERVARRLPPVAWDADLAVRAVGWADEMTRAGLRHDVLGLRSGELENVAIAAAPIATSEAVYELWFLSDPHRDAMLVPEARTVGVGVVCSGGAAYAVMRLSLSPYRPPGPTSAPPLAPSTGGGVAC
jgi:hypothetical protein